MGADSSSVEQAVSRALRDNLDRLQQTSHELHQAVADLVAACSSRRPTNALPPMLRAQTAAASLAAALEVLSRFVTAALQPAHRTPGEEQLLRLVSLPVPEPAATPEPFPSPPPHTIPMPMGAPPQPAPEAAEATPQEMPATPPFGGAEPDVTPAIQAEAQTAPEVVASVAPPHGEAHVEAAEPPISLPETPFPEVPPVAEPVLEVAIAEPPAEQPGAGAELEVVFDLAGLSLEEQDLHRRANRVAKVSMQDIQMLRPEQVRLGRMHKDICLRLRDDIERAHKEYDRRFQSIMGHPVDYFYRWMVEILGGGDPEALGEYPYPSPVLRR